MSNSCVTPWAVAPQDPLSMGFPGKNTGVGSPFPSPGDLPDSGSKPMSPDLADGFFTTEPPGKPNKYMLNNNYFKHQWTKCPN